MTSITKGNVITKLIRSFELSKNCIKIRVPGVMMRTDELGTTGFEPYTFDSQWELVVVTATFQSTNNKSDRNNHTTQPYISHAARARHPQLIFVIIFVILTQQAAIIYYLLATHFVDHC